MKNDQKALLEDMIKKYTEALILHEEVAKANFMDKNVQVISFAVLMWARGIKNKSPEIWDMCEQAFENIKVVGEIK